MAADGAAILREHGLRVTAQRLAVLRGVAARPHSTADDIDKFVQEKIGAISRQAVYDALGVLTERGVLRRIEPAGSSARYETRVGDDHHHLICRTCGTVVDIGSEAVTTPLLSAADGHGFTIHETEVTYWGSCPDCQAAANAQAADTRTTITP